MTRVALFSSKNYDKQKFEQHNNEAIELVYFDCHLNLDTVNLAQGFDVICVFVNDTVDAAVLAKLSEYQIKLVALRCAGFNNVDLTAAKRLAMPICRVPEYSPEAVAEHSVGLMLSLSRKFHKAYNRVKEDNFSLNGLMGFNLNKKTVGIIGTGKIGLATLRILKGFGCELLCYDPSPCPAAIDLGASYVDLNTLFSQADIISLHCPLTPDTQHIIDAEVLAQVKPGVMLINTSRGGLIDTQAIIMALKQKTVAYLGLDVYEQEGDLFFEDLSDTIIEDDVFQRLLTFPNVLITGHQGFFTEEALNTIAKTTLNNIAFVIKGDPEKAQLL